MRYFLLTKFVCAKCGNPLVIDDKPPMPPKMPHHDPYFNEPTGAAKHDILVSIIPCQACEKPFTRLRDTAKAVLAAIGDDDATA